MTEEVAVRGLMYVSCTCAVGDMDDTEDEVADHEGVNVLSYQRGMAPYVFIPWDQVASSMLNLPVDKMDVYIAG